MNLFLYVIKYSVILQLKSIASLSGVPKQQLLLSAYLHANFRGM